MGVLLLAVTYGLIAGVQQLAQGVFDYDMQAAIERAPKADKDLSMQLVFLVSVVNGIFEELFVAGYIITALTPRRGMWMAINVSVVVRLLYHLYQGPIGVLTSCRWACCTATCIRARASSGRWSWRMCCSTSWR